MMVETFQQVIDALPFMRWLGLRVEWVKPGRCRIRLPVRPEMLQVAGILHGGIIASLVDVAGGVAVMSALSPHRSEIRSIEMKVNYFHPVRGGEVWAEAHLVHLGKRTAVTLCRVLHAERRLCAMGTVTFARLDRRT